MPPLKYHNPIRVRDIYYVWVRYKGKEMRRSTGLCNLDAAKREQAEVDERLYQLEKGLVTLPVGVTPRDFLLFNITMGATKETVSAKMENL